MNSIKLWLDDVRPAPDGWVHCETAEAVWQFLRFERDRIEEMSLDHDLGDGSTGYNLLCWMEANDLWPRNRPRVHSANPAGAARMLAVIERKYAEENLTQ